MSELTMCNFCAFELMELRYGKENVRVIPAHGSLGGVEVQVRRDGEWPAQGSEPEVWFMELSGYCVC